MMMMMMMIMMMNMMKTYKTMMRVMTITMRMLIMRIMNQLKLWASDAGQVMWRISPRMPTSWGYSPLKTSWKSYPGPWKQTASSLLKINGWKMKPFVLGQFRPILGSLFVSFQGAFLLNLSPYVTHTISISPLSTAPLGGRHHLHLWPWAWQKQNHRWLGGGFNQPNWNICASQNGFIISHQFLGVNILQKYEWNHHLVELFFTVFFKSIDSTKHTWNLKDCFWQQFLFYV